QALLPLETLASGREPGRDVRCLPGEQQQNRKLAAEDRHARVLEVAVAFVDQLGQVGADSRAVPSDGRQRKPLLHGGRSYCGNGVTCHRFGLSKALYRVLRCRLEHHRKCSEWELPSSS